MKGCNLPFYDYLDSYSDEFRRIIETALIQHPSLLGVHEVADDLFYASYEEQWKELGYDHLEQVFFSFDDEYEDYLQRHTSKNSATLEGCATAFLDGDSQYEPSCSLEKH